MYICFVVPYLPVFVRLIQKMKYYIRINETIFGEYLLKIGEYDRAISIFLNETRAILLSTTFYVVVLNIKFII
jgi:hypothetical protein